MKLIDQAAIERIEARMWPGALSREGFLGRSERLVDVLARDRATLERLGIAQSELASKLASLLEGAIRLRKSPVTFDGYRIWLRRFKGSQRCPFLDDETQADCESATHAWLGSLDWRVRNLITGEEQAGPGLIAHLIGEHGFFEGLGSPYRVEPEALARLLQTGDFGSGLRPQ